MTETKMKQKILIADDEVEIRESLARALSRDYETDLVENAEQAIEHARTSNYAGILLDNQMHDGHENSGLYALEYIREFNAEVPVFLCTSALTDKVKEQASKLGATRSYRKPISVLEILAQLKRSKELNDN